MKGLLLNYEYGMWDAVLQKIKTNTRRAHKTLEPVNQNPDKFQLVDIVYRPEKSPTPFARFKEHNSGQIIECSARFALGEVLFLQEPTMNTKGFLVSEEDKQKDKENVKKKDEEDMIFYMYRDHNGYCETDHFGLLIETAKKRGARWTNKMFMGQKEARYFAKITKIEVERVKSITEADCLAEGIQKNEIGYFFTQNGRKVLFDTPQKAYFGLYNLINRNSPENPWVFSYHFELCDVNGN